MIQSSSNRQLLVGASLLIAGCAIGGGMLALPIISAAWPLTICLAMMFVCWLLMAYSAYILADLHRRFPANADLSTMVGHFLGRPGAWLTGLLYFSLLYALVVAYIHGGSTILSTWFPLIAKKPLIGFLLYALVVGALPVRAIHWADHSNRFLMLGKCFCFFILLGLLFAHHAAGSSIWPSTNFHYNQKLLNLLPVYLSAFGFANLVPSLRSYLNQDIILLRWSIFLGSFIPFVLYSVWLTAILRMVSPTFLQLPGTHQNNLSTLITILQQTTHSPWIQTLAQIFAFAAISTSFIGVSLSLKHLLNDSYSRARQQSALLNWLLMYVPALMILTLFGATFLQTLAYAGVTAFTLFGVIPCALSLFSKPPAQLPHQSFLTKPIALTVFLVCALSLWIVCVRQI